MLNESTQLAAPLQPRLANSAYVERLQAIRNDVPAIEDVPGDDDADNGDNAEPEAVEDRPFSSPSVNDCP